MLAGDHLKSASDLGVPLVGIGLLYRESFHQMLSEDGSQRESFPKNDMFVMPMSLVKDQNGLPIILSLSLGKGKLYFQFWKIQVGRVDLYLLDTNVEKNSQEYQDICNRLYDDDRKIRL